MEETSVPSATFDYELQRPLEEAALIASGVKTQLEREHYLSLFRKLVSQITAQMPKTDEISRARFLFNWLWQVKPQRYLPGGYFLLNKVLEAQIRPVPGPVGNCLGLTILYNSLARQFGLKVATIHLEKAFHGVPHVFTSLFTGDKHVDIEHISADGFNQTEHLDNPERELWGDDELIADIYLSRGNILFDARKWLDAIICYNMALEINPKYQKAGLNRAMAVSQVAT
ncbi:MAG: tetratricopeptide repeat protein [Dehalococcoidia bacterium]|nr:tetratricopeptide repeat protein [Dehalococcoidia bacterium]